MPAATTYFLPEIVDQHAIETYARAGAQAARTFRKQFLSCKAPWDGRAQAEKLLEETAQCYGLRREPPGTVIYA